CARLEAAVVDDHVLRPRRVLAVVRERAVHANRCRRVVLLREVLPDRRAALRAKPLDERIEEHRTSRLVAATDAEVRAEERTDGDDVREGPRLQPDVLAAVVGVDPGDGARGGGGGLAAPPAPAPR